MRATIGQNIFQPSRAGIPKQKDTKYRDYIKYVIVGSRYRQKNKNKLTGYTVLKSQSQLPLPRETKTKTESNPRSIFVIIPPPISMHVEDTKLNGDIEDIVVANRIGIGIQEQIQGSWISCGNQGQGQSVFGVDTRTGSKLIIEGCGESESQWPVCLFG